MNIKKKQIYCNNCEKPGHEYKDCESPIISWGIILINLLDKNIHLNHKKTDILSNNYGIKINNIQDIELVNKYKDSIQFLLIRRKHSYGYTEFIRGRYKTDNYNGIKSLFQQMIPEEIEQINNNEFDLLWKEMWNNDNYNNGHLKKEYDLSEIKFNILREGSGLFSLNYYIENVNPNYNTHEWGFPKGRRNRDETSIECALREFNEETFIDINKINVINEITPIEEILIGTDGVKYKHIYYVAELLDNNIILNIPNNGEIGDIGIFDFFDAKKHIRDYHIDKLEILFKVYMYYLENLFDHFSINK